MNSATASVTPAKELVLIVEDDNDIRECVAEALQLEGYGVGVAAHGRDALRLLHSGFRPSVILLDMMMPVMDGWAFLGHLRRDPELATIPVVVVSACNPEREVAAVIKKPFEFDDLVKTIKRCASC